MGLRVTNIQRFSLHDGPGIRTTIFLKGCSITCPWCCNPENIKTSAQFYFKNDDCIDCRRCIEACPHNILGMPTDIWEIDELKLSTCLECRRCVETCPTSALGIYGEKITTDELLNILEKDEDYYSQTNGGVTFSGGEPLLQANGIIDVIKHLKDKNISVTVETSLFAPLPYLKMIEEFVDLFIVDIKILDPKSSEKILQANLKDFKLNFKEIIEENKPYIARFPIIKPFTLNDENIDALINLVQEYKIEYLEIFPVHDFGANKYSSMGMKSKNFESVAEDEFDNLVNKLENISVKVKILDL